MSRSGSDVCSVAELIADYMVAVMSGLSAVAREGYDPARVIRIAALAATALTGKLTDQQAENF